MKNLITTLFLAGSLALGGCGNETTEKIKKLEQRISKVELQQYYLENNKIYEDFMELCKKNPDKKETDCKACYEIYPSYASEYITFFGENNAVTAIWIRVKNFHYHMRSGLWGSDLDAKINNTNYFFKDYNGGQIYSSR